MSVIYVDQNSNSGFIHETQPNITDYREYLQNRAEMYFQDNPKDEFYCITVTDSDERKSCIYEFHRTVEYSVTLY